MQRLEFYNRQAWERPVDPPPGWIQLPAPEGFCQTFGPVWARRDGADGLAVGFRCTERHLNPSGFCHGSALSAFADMQAYGIQHMIGYRRALVPTVSMTLDFLAVVNCGDWVTGELEVIRQSRNLVFSMLRATAGDRLVLTARGIFKTMEMSELSDTSYFDMIGPEIERRLTGLAV